MRRCILLGDNDIPAESLLRASEVLSILKAVGSGSPTVPGALGIETKILNQVNQLRCILCGMFVLCVLWMLYVFS